MLESALGYVEQGFSVIPLIPRDKKPAVKWEEYQKRKPTKDELTAWFKDNKRNIGIVTGAVSNLTVIDLDGKDAYEWAGDSDRGIPATPIVKTGKEYGYHLYCSYNEKLRNFQARTDLPHIDLRSEGGYVVAPPSIHPNGSTYQWITEPSTPVSPIPAWFLDTILNNSLFTLGSTTLSKYNTNTLTNNNIYNNIFSEHRKDIDLYHVAWSMMKGRLEPEYAQKVLEILINSWGEDDPKWAATKVLSAIKRGEMREKSLAKEVRDWIDSSSGVFYSSELKTFLHISSLDEEKNLSTILRRLIVDKIIERHGTKNGCFRKIEERTKPINWIDADCSELPVLFPFDIHKQVITTPKSIVIVAGTSNAGKTAFVLDFINRNAVEFKGKIHYFSSEMGIVDIKNRMGNFGIDIEYWRDKFNFYQKSANFQDEIYPDDINIIDFLEIHKDFSEIGEQISKIHQKLNTGLCIISIQKKEGSLLGRGAEFSMERAYLYVSIDYGIIRIVKGKNWRTKINPNGLYKRFKIEDGCNIKEDVRGWQKDIKPIDFKEN